MSLLLPADVHQIAIIAHPDNYLYFYGFWGLIILLIGFAVFGLRSEYKRAQISKAGYQGGPRCRPYFSCARPRKSADTFLYFSSIICGSPFCASLARKTERSGYESMMCLRGRGVLCIYFHFGYGAPEND